MLLFRPNFMSLLSFKDECTDKILYQTCRITYIFNNIKTNVDILNIIFQPC